MTELITRSWFETVTGVASAVLAVTVLGMAIVLAPAAWSFWRTFKRVRDMLDKVYADVMPLMRHASNIADNLDYISTSIRSDVQQVNATIASANRRLQRAAAQTETRMNEFNALLRVVQQEAEQAFVSTASAVRGVRTGAAAFGDLVDEDPLDGGEGGMGNGDDDDDEYVEYDEDDEQEGGGAARPRIRSRREHRA